MNHINKGNFHLLACFAPSVDQYHKKTKLIHLVSSIFYTRKLKWEEILKKYKGVDGYKIVYVTSFIDTPYLDAEDNIFYFNTFFFFGLNMSMNFQVSAMDGVLVGRRLRIHSGVLIW